MTLDDQEATVRAITRTCRGPQRAGAAAEIAAALEAGETAQAIALDAQSRPGCGYDVNTLILAQPLDGQAHEAACPQCGQRITWTAPVFPAEET